MAIATIPPIAVIAIVTPLGPFDPEPLAEEEDEADVEEFVVEAGEGGFVVETGELLFRQLVSSEAPETLISDEPPELPCESVIDHTIDVPAAKSAVQSNDTALFGGVKIKASPPGMYPAIVPGCTAPS